MDNKGLRYRDANHGECRRVPVSIHMEQLTIQRIDNLRSELPVSRSAVVESLLMEALDIIEEIEDKDDYE